MPPTPGRTTIKAAIDGFVSTLRTNLAADPPTVSKPFRRVEVGVSGTEEYARPFLAMTLTRTRPVSVADNDKVVEVGMALRLVTDVSTVDSHAAMLDKIGALEDYLDGITDTGVLDGAEGFDDRVWTFDYPRSTAGSRVAVASATQSFVVSVERQWNRVPAS